MMYSCVIGIGGFSGSGKTTLIEKALPHLKKSGLSVGVLKHTHHHGLDFDRDEKDTGRFYKAGADVVCGIDRHQAFLRYREEEDDISDVLKKFPADLDLIIVEGYKEKDIPRVWLKTRRSERPPVKQCSACIDRNAPDYVHRFLGLIEKEMDAFMMRRRIWAGLLVGGRSSRMGSPKALLKLNGEPLGTRMHRILSAASDGAVLLGTGEVPEELHPAPSLPDIPGAGGPMAGILAAFRWDPFSSWIITAVDLPFMNAKALKWLLRQRRPGVWAVMPKIRNSRGVEATASLYEPQFFPLVEDLLERGCLKLQALSGHPKVFTPIIPRSLEKAWTNVNTPSERRKITGLTVV